MSACSFTPLGVTLPAAGVPNLTPPAPPAMPTIAGGLSGAPSLGVTLPAAGVPNLTPPAPPAMPLQFCPLDG